MQPVAGSQQLAALQAASGMQPATCSLWRGPADRSRRRAAGEEGEDDDAILSRALEFPSECHTCTAHDHSTQHHLPRGDLLRGAAMDWACTQREAAGFRECFMHHFDAALLASLLQEACLAAPGVDVFARHLGKAKRSPEAEHA